MNCGTNDKITDYVNDKNKKLWSNHKGNKLWAKNKDKKAIICV